MSFTKLPLGEAVELTRTGSTPSTSHPEFFNGSIPWFTPGDIGDTRDLVKSTRYITEEGLKSGKAKLFDKEMLLVTCIGDIGRVGVLQQPSSSNQQITALKFKSEIDVYYAYYWFVAHKNKLEQLANQAIVPILNNERLEEVEFFYPPLPEQRRIADLLSRADRLRRLRRVGDSLSASLLQSVFLEMFGEYKHNLVEFREVVKIDRSIASDEDAKTLPYVGLEDIEKDKGDFIAGYQPIAQNMLATNFKFSPDHVLYGKLRPYLNKVAMPKFYGVCTTEILPLLPVEGKVNKAYLWTYLLSKDFVNWASNNVAGANLPRLSPELLGDYPLPVPPLPEQEQFAAVVRRVESLRARAGESARQGEGLFQSLLSQSFGG